MRETYCYIVLVEKMLLAKAEADEKRKRRWL